MVRGSSLVSRSQSSGLTYQQGQKPLVKSDAMFDTLTDTFTQTLSDTP